MSLFLLSEEELKRNEEWTAEVQSSAPVATVWRRIVQGSFVVLSGEQASQRLTGIGIRVSPRASLVLHATKFSNDQKIVNLGIVSGEDIGFHEKRGYRLSEWRNEILRRGYRLPSVESIVTLRSALSGVTEGDHLVSLMQPVSVVEEGQTINLILAVGRWSGSEYLVTEYGDEDELWYPEHKFIVEIPGQTK